MKQAILITAYKDLDFLSDMISFFDDNFDIYIHIDKKCKEKIVVSKRNIKIISNYSIYWGSEKHLFAILDLIKLTRENGEYSYYHLITGADFPLKKTSDFLEFFNEQNKTCYIEYFKLPRKGWGPEGGFERVKYYWIGNQWFDVRKK